MADGIHSYDLEAAMTKLPPAIEEAERVANVAVPHACDTVTDVCKEVGAQELIRSGEAVVVTMQGVNEMFKDMIGQEGDSISTGSAHGCLAYAKKQDAVLNGGN